jgi:hypothetical protein
VEASAQVIVPGRRLGKLPSKFDERTARLAKFIDVHAPRKAPKSHTAIKKVSDPWGMMKNDALGDCTCAALGHHVQIWTANNGAERTPADDAVVELYNRVNGGKDNGANMLDVLNSFSSFGLAGLDKPSAFVSVERMNLELVRYAAWLFGGLYAGYDLPVTAQGQGKRWDYLPNTNGNEAGSWGGHATASAVKYDPKGYWIVSWGDLYYVTNEFHNAYCSELYAILDPDWLGDDQRSPQGFRLKALQQYLASL